MHASCRWIISRVDIASEMVVNVLLIVKSTYVLTRYRYGLRYTNNFLSLSLPFFFELRIPNSMSKYSSPLKRKNCILITPPYLGSATIPNECVLAKEEVVSGNHG